VVLIQQVFFSKYVLDAPKAINSSPERIVLDQLERAALKCEFAGNPKPESCSLLVYALLGMFRVFCSCEQRRKMGAEETNGEI
jgi:hypothetical protein